MQMQCVSPNRYLFCPASGHEGCWDQGAHGEWQRPSPVRSLHQVKVHLWASGSEIHLCITAFEKTPWQFFPPPPATWGTWRSTLRWRGTSAKPESKEYRSVEPRRRPALWKPPVHSSHIHAVFFCLQLHGMMRVILEPLIGDVPIAGAVSMFFIKRPVRPSAFTSACPYIPINTTHPNISILAFHAIDFSYILTILPLSFVSFPSNWTSIGLVWRICWISLGLSESCWSHSLWGYQAYK